jgi:hypothetical protein
MGLRARTCFTGIHRNAGGSKPRALEALDIGQAHLMWLIDKKDAARMSAVPEVVSGDGEADRGVSPGRYAYSL